jgi:hypothetical protein
LPHTCQRFASFTCGARPGRITSPDARERKLDIYFVADRSPEILDTVSANAVVVFDGGGKESEAIVRAARERNIALRVVDVRAFVTPARL